MVEASHDFIDVRWQRKLFEAAVPKLMLFMWALKQLDNLLQMWGFRCKSLCFCGLKSGFEVMPNPPRA